MKEARELQTQIEQLERHIALQDNKILRLQNKIENAVGFLQKGFRLDIVKAIEILKDKNEN